jgi:hypothetical protein
MKRDSSNTQALGAPLLDAQVVFKDILIGTNTLKGGEREGVGKDAMIGEMKYGKILFQLQETGDGNHWDSYVIDVAAHGRRIRKDTGYS